MANICDNKFYFTTNGDLDKWKEKFRTLFSEELSGFITDFGENYLEGYFESRWNFPAEIMENFLPEDESGNEQVYFRCLSEEYGCGYVAMNIYKDGVWRTEQCFDI